MAKRLSQYVNPVLTAIKKLGGSASPAEVCATVIKDMRLEGSPLGRGLSGVAARGSCGRDNQLRGDPDVAATIRTGQVMAGGASAGREDTEAAIRSDPELTDAQKDALLGVYRSYKAANR